MRKSFKYRWYPKKTQKLVSENTLAYCRLVSNRLFAERRSEVRQSLSSVAQAIPFPVRKAAMPVLPFRPLARVARCREAVG